LLDLLETLLGFRVLGVGVRVIAAGQLAVRGADIGLGSPLGQPEWLVGIFEGAPL
jgi:hypothetical protein